MILGVRSARPDWWLRSVGARSGDGYIRTRFDPGITAVGFFRGIQTLRKRRGRLLDLYAREWEGKPLKDDEFVISADEKTSIQARRRKHPSHACRPRATMGVEHEYWRCGALTYLSALDVHHARVFGRCEPQNGIAPFDRLVEQVMTRPPYNDARRVSGSWTTVLAIADSRPSNVCGNNTLS